MKRLCPVYRRACPIHGFIHGGEAEELRSGIEEIMAEASVRNDRDAGEDIADDLRRLLDRVDARDSCAFVEQRETKGGG